MRLVMEVYYTDGCTYGFTETLPLVCDSPELALIRLEELIKSSSQDAEFDFYGHSFDVDTFYNESGNVELPNIYTIDEWFAQHWANGFAQHERCMSMLDNSKDI